MEKVNSITSELQSLTSKYIKADRDDDEDTIDQIEKNVSNLAKKFFADLNFTQGNISEGRKESRMGEFKSVFDLSINLKEKSILNLRSNSYRNLLLMKQHFMNKL